MIEIEFFDRAKISGTRMTDDGYLLADARVARIGIQDYLGTEIDPDNQIGLRDKAVVRVYRPEEEVFTAESLKSYAHRPVTNDHPAESVTADNWKKLAVGQTGGDVVRDGEWVRVPLVLMDAEMVRQVQNGKRQLSMGYVSVIDATPGTAPDGTPYDAVQRGLRMNHLAVVAAARAGGEARIGDNRAVEPITTKEDSMSDALKTVVLGDKAVQVATSDAAIVENFRTETTRKISDMADAHKRELDDRDTTIGTLRAELKQAQDAAPGPDKIASLVAERVELEKVALTIDSKIVLAGKTNEEVRKAVVAKALGDEMVKDASDAEITGMFKAVSRDAQKTGQSQEQLRDALSGSGGRQVQVGDAKAQYDQALAASVTNLNAHRK